MFLRNMNLNLCVLSALPSLVLWVSHLCLTGTLSHRLAFRREPVCPSWHWRGWQHQQSTAAVWNGAVGRCGIWLAGWMPVLSIWPLGEDKYIVVPLYLVSSKQETTLFHPTIPWCWIPCLFHFFFLTKMKWKFNSYTCHSCSEVGFRHVSDFCSWVFLAPPSLERIVSLFIGPLSCQILSLGITKLNHLFKTAFG